ncbi:MAG: serine/threonine protein kinase [Bdellovibrionia bacterium]
MAEVLKKFGRYFLLDLLAQGGMAEIFRARLASSDGAGRIIVIKRIQGGYSTNHEFIQMFKSEIKVTMGFNHPNIVQLYDFGEEDNQPYIAMEWVDGRNLRQLMNRFLELKKPFPIELVAHIIEQAAAGLHYAHSYKDKISGEALNLIHRDISPQNILTSFEGGVKLIDFGIAKTTANIESTRTGVIKGKPSYLSPEQISGEELDGRSDLFALGAVLWELLTGKKLFSGDSDLAVLKQIESAQTHVTPPSTVNPKVPKELDYIVLKTLAKTRDKRFQTAEELQRALHKFLYTYNPDFNPADLSYYGRELFKNELVEDRKLIQKLSEKAQRLLTSNSPSEQPQEKQKPKAETEFELDQESSDLKADIQSSGNRAIEMDKNERFARVDLEATDEDLKLINQEKRTHLKTLSPTPNPMKNRSSDRILSKPGQKEPISRSFRPKKEQKNWLGTLFISLLTVGLIGTILGPTINIDIPVLSALIENISGSQGARLTLEGQEKNVSVFLNGQKIAGKLPMTLRKVPIGIPFQIAVTSSDGRSFQQELTLKKGEARTLPITLIPMQRPSTGGETKETRKIQLKLNILPKLSQTRIVLNQSVVDPNYPVIQVPLDTPLELSIDAPGHLPYRHTFSLESRQLYGLREWPMEINLESGHSGILTIHSVPSADAIIQMSGSTWKRRTPVENEKFPAGVYQLQLINEVLGMEKVVRISIQEGATTTVEERLSVKK